MELRNRRAQLLQGFSLLALLLILGCDRGTAPQSLGRPAPEFTLNDGHNAISLGHLKGQVVLLNFWASWCAPCIAELPSLIQLHHTLPQLAIVAVSVDQDESAYRRFLDRNHVDLLTLRDPDSRISNLFGTSLIPETYVIDRQGVIRRKLVNAQDWTNPDFVTFLRSLEV